MWIELLVEADSDARQFRWHHSRRSYAARPRGRRGLGEMHVDNAPVSALLAEYHRRARDVLIAVPARPHRRLLPDPIRAGVAMAPDHRQLVRDDAADVKRGPIAARDVLLIELPEPCPMRAAVISVAVEVEEHGLRHAAPQILQRLPIEAGVDIEVFVQSFQQTPAVLRRAADQLGFLYRYVCHYA